MGRGKMAAGMGGYLAVIDNAAEDTWLMGMFRPVSDTAFVGRTISRGRVGMG